MMKRIVALTLLVWLTAIAVQAQRQQDFASRFMSLYGEEAALSCHTVSPDMMGRIVPLTHDSLPALRQVLSQIKSIRVVLPTAETADTELVDKARQLALDNARRYKLYAETDGRSIYLRKRGKFVVEVVMIAGNQPSGLAVVSITGNMTEDFFSELMKI